MKQLMLSCLLRMDLQCCCNVFGISYPILRRCVHIVADIQKISALGNVGR